MTNTHNQDGMDAFVNEVTNSDVLCVIGVSTDIAPSGINIGVHGVKDLMIKGYSLA